MRISVILLSFQTIGDKQKMGERQNIRDTVSATLPR